MKIRHENDVKITKMNSNLKTTQNDGKINYKISIFGACAPYSRLIYWIASSISLGKKDDMSSKSGPWLLQINGTIIIYYIIIIQSKHSCLLDFCLRIWKLKYIKQ